MERYPAILAESQNVKAKHECDRPNSLSQTVLVPINEDDCTAVGGTWNVVPAHGIPAPECGRAPTTPVNQHGIAVGGICYQVIIGSISNDVVERKFCVLLIRYNISSADPIPPTYKSVTSGTSKQNGVNSPLKDRQLNEVLDPYKSFTERPANSHRAARLNTYQFGGTFQDRSYTFEIRKPPIVDSVLVSESTT